MTAPEEAPRAGAGGEEAGEGLRLLGVLHGERRRAPLWEAASWEPEEAELVSFRDLGALVYPGPLRVEAVDPEEVLAHHRRLDATLQHATVLPAPFGIVFRGAREVARFLRDRYTELGDALVLVEGRWEFRVHLAPADPGLPEALALNVATRVYADLRKAAHAAIPFPRDEPGTFSAAFLVDRLETRDFLERVEELGRLHAELEPDVTGPWPPYDFVVMRP